MYVWTLSYHWGKFFAPQLLVILTERSEKTQVSVSHTARRDQPSVVGWNTNITKPTSAVKFSGAN
jgi:hypothetical protein